MSDNESFFPKGIYVGDPPADKRCCGESLMWFMDEYHSPKKIYLEGYRCGLCHHVWIIRMQCTHD